jgi:hypothetical protein
MPGHLRHGVLLSGLLATACSTATSHSIEEETLNPDWRGRSLGKVLVVGVHEDRAQRVSAASTFAERLSQHGVDAEPSYSVLPDLASLDSEGAVRAAIRGREFDTIFCASLIEGGERFDHERFAVTDAIVRLFSEGHFTRLAGHAEYYESGYYVLDMGLWDARTLEPIWEAMTDSYSQEELPEDTRKFADFLVEALRERDLLPPGS